MSKYKKLLDYEGIELGEGEIFRFACCDCGLVHDMVAVPEDSGKIGIAFKRNKRSTGQLRRFQYGYLQQGGFGNYIMHKE